MFSHVLKNINIYGAMFIFLMENASNQVFEVVLAWVKRDLDIRNSQFPELLAKVRMPLLTPQYLTDKVATENLIRSSHECR